MSRIFLSYAREDVDVAKRLAELITSAGHEVWWDRHLRAGARFAAEIDRALREAQAIVVLWSQHSIESAWVQDEAAEGRDTGRLIPVSIAAAKPPLGFRQFHTFDLALWRNGLVAARVDDLLNAISHTCSPGSQDTPKASPSAKGQFAAASICVLPFENMSGDTKQEYFSDGITEDIITDLSKVSTLFVTARNAAFNFKGRSVDLKAVARSLGVSHILEGSVRKDRDRVRITAQLIEGKTGGCVWGDRYDRCLTNIFGIQDEIAEAIVGALQLELLPKEASAIQNRGTTDVEAYNLYLMARHHWISGLYGDIRTDQAIVRICSQALSLDPKYSQAWALMALAQAQLRFWHGTSEDALPAAERALALDPNAADARCVKARYLEEDGRPYDAEGEIEAALQAQPDSWEVNRAAGRLMFRQGRIPEAIAFFEKTTALMDSDFYSPEMLVTCYSSRGDFELMKRAADQAIERCEEALAIDPAHAPALAAGAVALLARGDVKRAKEWADRALLINPDNPAIRFNLACAYAARGYDPDQALDILEPVLQGSAGVTLLKHVQVDPDLDSLRQLPRFKDLLKSAKKRLTDQTKRSVRVRSVEN